jgi:hypothetical protein
LSWGQGGRRAPPEARRQDASRLQNTKYLEFVPSQAGNETARRHWGATPSGLTGLCDPGGTTIRLLKQSNLFDNVAAIVPPGRE